MTARGASGRKLLLAAFGLVVALALLGVAELGLRLTGFGGQSPMLRPLDLAPPVAGVPAGSRLYEIHPRLAEIYFARAGPGGAEFVGGHRRELVVLPKPAGMLRVVMVGASTIEGFPMPRHLTAARFLEAMLRHLLPERRVEVLNLGVTAVASFPIRKIAIEAMEQLEPDLLLVYEAHNEFFGAFGMASYQAMGRSPALMELGLGIRRLALSQAVEALTAPAEAAGEAGRAHLIQVMAAVPEIEPDGEHHAAARRSLTANFRAIVRAGRERGVPVVLSTVVSLERDLVPVTSFEGDLPRDKRAAFAERLAAARQRVEGASGTVHASEDGGAELLPLLESLAAEAPRHAEAEYWLGRSLELAERGPEATEAYRRARDLDAMPWRAGRDKNSALRALAAEERVPLADCEAAFAAASNGGAAPGATTWALFADHVHPNLEGQALLARAFLDTLVGERLVEVDPMRLATLPEPRRIAESLGVNALELYAATHKMVTLFRAPPFSTHNAAAAERLDQLLAGFRARAGPVERQALELWEEGSRAAGFALPISWFGGVAALRAGDLERARHYLHAAQASSLPFSDERSATQLLQVVAALLSGESPLEVGRHAAAALHEARQVAALPNPPSSLLARTLAGLFYLTGDAASGAARAVEARELAATAPAWQKPFLAGLPDPATLAALSPFR